MPPSSQLTLRYFARSFVALCVAPLGWALFGSTATQTPFTFAVLANMALFFPTYLASVAIHEVAHAVVGRMMGDRVWRITIGTGPRMFRCRILGCDVHVHALPFSGRVAIVPSEIRWWRTKAAISIAAGPVTNGALLWVAARLAGWEEDGLECTFLHGQFNPWGSMMLVNAAMLLFSVVPLPGRVFWNDAAAFASVLFAKVDVRDIRLHPVVTAAAEACERGDFAAAMELCETTSEEEGQRPVLRSLRAAILLQQRDFEGAYRIFRELVADPVLTDRERDPLKNNLAWSSLFVADPDALREAHALSQSFVRKHKQVGYGHGTYGAVLAKEGLYDQAIRELERAWALNASPRLHAHNAAWLAYCHGFKGDADTARSYLETARRLDPNCYSIPIAEEAVPSVPHNSVVDTLSPPKP